MAMRCQCLACLTAQDLDAIEAGQGFEVGQNHEVIATRSLSTMLVQLFEDPLMLSQLFNRHCSCPSAFIGVIS
jgi:hypothetical protein